LPALRSISNFILIVIYLSAIEVSFHSKFFVWMGISDKEREEGTDSRSGIKRKDGKELSISMDMR